MTLPTLDPADLETRVPEAVGSTNVGLQQGAIVAHKQTRAKRKKHYKQTVSKQAQASP